MEWSDNNLIGVKTIDDQHKQLFTLINKITNTEKKLSVTSCACLMDYARDHFAAEERLMKEINYPQFQEHKRLHDKLRRAFEKACQRIISDQSVEQENIKRVLQAWLTIHIGKHDVQIATYIKEKG